MEPNIVNPNPKYSQAKLTEPTSLGYVYVAAAVRSSAIPLVLPNRQRARLLESLKRLALDLERLPTVVKATVFKAIIMPPTARFSTYLRQRQPKLQPADFDVTILIQTTSPQTARDLQTAPEFEALLSAVRREAHHVEVLAARNVKRIRDVDTTRQGLFLFNHFAAEDHATMLKLWDYLADWYMVETGLRTSVALAPLEGEHSDFAIVNWARWDTSLPKHIWNQLSKKSFWKYVVGNLNANHASAMPIYYRLA